VVDLVVMNGKVVAPDGQFVALDLAVENGRIVAMGPGLEQDARRTVDAHGHLVLPGVIDLHTHLRSPLGEASLFTGETSSAVAGGTTTICDFAYPAGTRFEMDFAAKKVRLEREALCDFCLHTVVRAPEHLKDVQTHTVKVFFSASGLGTQAGGALGLLQSAVADGRVVLAHVEAMDDYLAILRRGIGPDSPGRVHIAHVPHQRFVNLVRTLGNERVTMETCPHYLLWEWIQVQPGCDVNPPVEPSDLWPEVRAGHISTIGTDHCSYTMQEKRDMHLPGFPGVETLLRTVYAFGVKAGRISWADLCRALSAGPARMLGLYPRKGVLQPGADADFVIFDTAYEELQKAPTYGRGDFSPYAGLRLGGKVLSTFVRGREVYSNGVADLNSAGWGIWQDERAMPGGVNSGI
jgi:dihydroorotase-like cyclic amidohydrolase